MSQEAAFRDTSTTNAGSMPSKGPYSRRLEGASQIAPSPQEDAALELLKGPLVCQKFTPGCKNWQPRQSLSQAVRPMTKQPAHHSSWDTFVDGATNGASSCRQGQNSERWDGSADGAHHDDGMFVTTFSGW